MSSIRRRPLRGNQSTENDSNADFDVNNNDSHGFGQEDDNNQEEEDSDLPTKKKIKK